MNKVDFKKNDIVAELESVSDALHFISIAYSEGQQNPEGFANYVTHKLYGSVFWGLARHVARLSEAVDAL